MAGRILTLRAAADLENSKIVLFDLETSGLSSSAEICQISATFETQLFNVYMVPKSLTPAATAITGLYVNMGELYLNDQRLDTVSPRAGLMSFITFLREIGNNVILVAHNGFRFDAPLILRHVENVGLLDEFMAVVKGFADTLCMFRDRLEDRRKEKKSFSQTALAFDFLGSASIEGAHDARIDVNILRKLITTIGLSDIVIQSNAKTTADFLRGQEALAVEKNHRVWMLLSMPDVSAGMIAKMAKTGISLEILQEAYANGSENAIKMLLGEDIGGRPRVTKNAKVLKRIVDQLKRIA